MRAPDTPPEIAIVAGARWLVPPARGRYIGFPRGVMSDGRIVLKYQEGEGDGRPGHHALPPVRTYVLELDECAPDASSVLRTPWADWSGRANHLALDEALVPLLQEHRPGAFLRDQGWPRVLLAGRPFRGGRELGWLWPIYDGGTGERGARVAIVWSSPSGSGFQIVREFAPSDGASEMSGVTLSDGTILLVGRVGVGFQRQARWWRLSCDGGEIIDRGALPWNIHWPVLEDAGSAGVLLIGRSAAGLIVARWGGSAWDQDVASLLPPPGWFGNYGYCWAAVRENGRLTLVTYGPHLPGRPKPVGGPGEYPGLMALDVLTSWVEFENGARRPFSGEVAVRDGMLRFQAGVREVCRVPPGALGDLRAVTDTVFGGVLPPMLDYRLRRE
jgi:hypothetical protein